MENTLYEIQFLCEEFVPLITQIRPDTAPLWGKMSVQHMVEHMADSFRQAYTPHRMQLNTPLEMVPKMQAFIESDKHFRPGTVNPLMSENLNRLRHSELSDAIDELDSEIEAFVLFFEENSGAKTLNPIFGELDFEGWTRLLWKHATHHLRQFGVHQGS